MIRIAIAGVMLYRIALILDASRFYYGRESGWHGLGNSHARFALFELALTICLLVGFLTPLCLVIMLLTYYRFDQSMGTITLGTYVCLHILAILLFCAAGSTLSVDSYLARRPSAAGLARAIRRAYRFLGSPSATDTRRYLFLGLVAYWVISFGALLNHASDQYWKDGDTVRAMLQSSYFSRVAGPARALERWNAGLARALSQLVVLAQGFFQLAMVALIRWRWGRRFVVWWGAGFFLVSLIALQLSYLPLTEICLWGLVFGRARTGDATTPTEPSVLRTRLRSARASAISVTAVLGMFGLTVLTFPQTERAIDGALGIDLAAVFDPLQPQLTDALTARGLNAPNVFNAADLQSGDAWPVIHRLGDDGSASLVPLSGVDGSRLWYHLSDVIYYGSSIPWRRTMVGMDLAALHQPGTFGYNSIETILRYDYRRNGRSGPVTYRVDLYRSRASQLTLSADERFESDMVYSYTQTIEE